MQKDTDSKFMLQNHVKNYETLASSNDKLAAIFEANGKDVSLSPSAILFNLDSESTGTLPLDLIEYRITDARTASDDGYLGAINYVFPGDPDLFTNEDLFAPKFGQGKSHATRDSYEGLVKFQIQQGLSRLSTNPRFG
ncbi:MAG: hypothetical protein R3293_06110 [Candidatus Promineifilaceae bacterium]|nr:hypothetical protein [Candidatus Promineifilaceae bacterium]